MGIGFAIPAEMAHSIQQSLIEDGHVTRGYLGVMIQDLDPKLADSFGYDSTEGALVSDMPEDSPARRAGIEVGDIITRFNGKKIDGVDQLRFEVAGTRPGTEVTVEIFRDGRQLEREVELVELESADASRTHGRGASALGMRVKTLSPEIARRLGMPTDREGVIVTEIDPLSAASEAGIRLNDVILSVDGHEIASVEDFEEYTSASDLERGVRLVIARGNSKRFVFLSVDK